jgi:23S rRNA pseudouridine1911/1915/1917 synthase
VALQAQSGGELSPVGPDEARPASCTGSTGTPRGASCFAKTEEAHWKLGRQFEFARSTSATSRSCTGACARHGFVIDKPIGPHPSKEKGYREKMVVRHDELGKPSVTIVRASASGTACTRRAVGDQEFTLVELELKTGRTHQIRVHLSEEGFPIVGDDMYGGRSRASPSCSRPRHASGSRRSSGPCDRAK